MRIDLLLGIDAIFLENEIDEFQYPRADRLIVGDVQELDIELELTGFSILVRIDLLLGHIVAQVHGDRREVSVSSCGSTYCWGE